MAGRMKLGSLCSGYGGLDLAVEHVFGAEVVWHAEIEAAPAVVFAHHWPNSPNLGDITAVDWAGVEPVDILTAGYPCQPFSLSNAGRRKGVDDVRHLWPYVREAIRHLRPRITVLENVPGHRSLGFDRVLGDMAEDGMHARWTSLRAADIGAPHGRERLFVVAYAANADGPRRQEHGRASAIRAQFAADEHGGRDTSTDTGSPAVGKYARESSAQETWAHTGNRSEDTGRERPAGIGRATSADASGERCDGRRRAAKYPRGPHATTYRLDHSLASWGDYGPAIERWGNIIGPPPPPTESRESRTHPRLNVRFAEWMMGLRPGWVADVGVPVDDGDQLSMFDEVKPPPREQARNHKLKMLGNGVLPQQAEAALIQMVACEVAA